MENNMSVTEPDQIVVEEPDEEDAFDEEWASAPRHRSRWRLVLVGGLVMAVTFLGGVLVQKEYGAESTAAADAPAGFPGGGSFPAGGMPEGAMPGGTVPGGADGTGSGAGEADAGGTDATSSVIGTVVSVEGEVWTVKDLGGTEHQITVPATATVTKEEEVAASDVAVGSTVDIEGTTGDSDELTASQITVR